MDDTISRQAAIALAKDICVPNKDGTVYKHRCIDPDAIKELPSAQSEIIKCKDCTWFDSPMVCLRHGRFVENNNWFCADGERRRE